MTMVTAKSVLNLTEERKLELRVQHIRCNVRCRAPEESTRIDLHHNKTNKVPEQEESYKCPLHGTMGRHDGTDGCFLSVENREKPHNGSRVVSATP